MTENLSLAAYHCKDETLRDPQERAPSAVRREAFTRVPASYIGKIIANDSRAAIPALHLVAYKLSRGDNFVLNVIDVVKRKLMGKHRFELGLKHLTNCRVLVRSQPNHRDYAVECLAPAEGFYCVTISDQVILKCRSAVVAFILAASVSPSPRTPGEIAARIGIKSRDATRKVLAECVRLGAVDTYVDEMAKVRVCRPDEAAKTGVAKNRGAKNQVAKNRGAQRTGKEEQRTREKIKESANTYEAASAASNAKWDFLVLSDWRRHHAVEALTADGVVEIWAAPPVVSSTRITSLLEYHGARAPHHLLTPHGVQQITALAAVAAAYCEETTFDMAFDMALDAVCNAVAGAIGKGQTIRNLAFIAVPVLKAAYNGGDWATHYPSNRLGDKLDDWRAWAEGKLIPQLNRVGVPTDGDALTSTRQLEALSDLFRTHGQARIEAACAAAKIEAGRDVCGWRFVTNFIKQPRR